MRAHNRMRKPNGRRWTMLRTAVFAAYGRTCHLCGHGGANQVDHVIPGVDPAGSRMGAGKPAASTRSARKPLS